MVGTGWLQLLASFHSGRIMFPIRNPIQCFLAMQRLMLISRIGKQVGFQGKGKVVMSASKNKGLHNIYQYLINACIKGKIICSQALPKLPVLSVVFSCGLLSVVFIVWSSHVVFSCGLLTSRGTGVIRFRSPRPAELGPQLRLDATRTLITILRSCPG